MAFYTPSTGQKLTVTNYNTHVRNRLVNYFTSTTNRDAEIVSPVEGMMAYTADTDVFWFYNGASWLPTTNPLYGRGLITQASKTSVQTGITTVTDITSLTVSFTAEALRTYKVSVWVGVGSSVSGDSVSVYITDAANTVLQTGTVAIPESGFNPTAYVEYYVTPGAGSVTYKARIARGTGSGSVAVSAGTTQPAYITVEDIGASGIPSGGGGGGGGGGATPSTGAFYVSSGNIGRDGYRFTPIGVNGVCSPQGATGYWADEGSGSRMGVMSGAMPGSSTRKAAAYAALGFNFVRFNCWYDGASGYTETQFLNGLYDTIDEYVENGIVCMPAYHGFGPGTNPSTSTLLADSYFISWLDGLSVRYADEPMVWLNPVNEPWSYSSTSDWVTVQTWLYDRVRTTNGYNGIFVADVPGWGQGLQYAPTEGVAFATGKTNVALGFHNYDKGNSDTDALNARNAGLAVIIGECGVQLSGTTSNQDSFDWVVEKADVTGYGCVYWWGAGNRNDDYVMRNATGSTWYDTSTPLTANGTTLMNLAASRPADPPL